jgi:radical SAM superfamily enzyme YgiQ (UPF0313 family)
MGIVRALLISTYDLGRQPFGLASPAAWLRRSGVDVDCVDVSRDELDDARVRAASLVAFYLPMHTATRLAGPLVERVRRVNPTARLAAYGLYAPLNADWLRGRGVAHVLGPEAEEDLARLATDAPAAGASPEDGDARPRRGWLPGRRLPLVQPDRSDLPPLSRYAALQMPDGSRRVAGATDASRGCKHLCRHCPIVPVYNGVFRAVPLDVVLADVRTQVDGGAEHISFGDPDFLNGPTHARRLVTRLAAECPGLTYDVTIKVEHLLRHADLLELLRDTGCLMVTSAVESIDDDVLGKLRKGHTRADFFLAVDLCRRAGLTLVPTFVPFTPWTTQAGYGELLDTIAALGLVPAVAPVQLGIRLLVTAESRLLELPEIREHIEPFDPASLTYPWRHRDPEVDALQARAMAIARDGAGASRHATFAAIAAAARGTAAGADTGGSCAPEGRAVVDAIPHLTEAWYCCAEPGADLPDLV